MPSFKKKSYKKPMRKRSNGPVRPLIGWTNPKQELKYKNFAVGTSTQIVLSSLQSVCLNGIATGTDINTREGRQVMNSVLEFKGFIEPLSRLSTAVSDVHSIRVMIIMDRSSNNSPSFPLMGELLDLTTPPISAYQQIMAPINLNNRNRFRILLDKIYHVGSGGANGQFGQRSHTLSYKIPLKVKTTYSDITDSLGVIVNNRITMCWFGDDIFADTSCLYGTARLRFHE